MSERVHICFHPSAGGSLLRALSLLGRTERVLSLGDDLACGPIHPFSAQQRAAFAHDVLGDDDPAGLAEHLEALWTAASRTDVTWVAWFSRRCASELAGVMELLSRHPRPPLVVDVADIQIVRDGQRSHAASRAAAAISANEMLAYDMIERAAPMPSSDFEAYRTTWTRLQRENAPLRVLEDSGLVSAHASYFDELLLAFANDWVSVVRVVGEATSSIERCPYRQVSDPFLFSRIYELIDAGDLEHREHPSSPRGLVRRRTAR